MKNVTVLYVSAQTTVNTAETIVSMAKNPDVKPGAPPNVEYPGGTNPMLPPGIYRIVSDDPKPVLSVASAAYTTVTQGENGKNPWPDPPGALVKQLGLNMADVKTFITAQGHEGEVIDK